MAIKYGARINDSTNFITSIDIDNETAETTGCIDGEPVEFSGGGSSDLAIAEIIMSSSISSSIMLSGAFLHDDDESSYSDNQDTIGAYDEKTVKMAMYKGVAILSGDFSGVTASVSGDIEDIGDGYFVITGNGTITIS